jgi:hypothetical protein
MTVLAPDLALCIPAAVPPVPPPTTRTSNLRVPGNDDREPFIEIQYKIRSPNERNLIIVKPSFSIRVMLLMLQVYTAKNRFQEYALSNQKLFQLLTLALIGSWRDFDNLKGVRFKRFI